MYMEGNDDGKISLLKKTEFTYVLTMYHLYSLNFTVISKMFRITSSVFR